MDGEWWTAPTESADNGSLVMVTGRRDVEAFRSNPRFDTRVEMSWAYDSPGMPSDEDAEMMEKVTDALMDTFHKDPVAVMTGIYTGDGQRDWVFYTLSLNIFQKKLNQALASLPLLPLRFHAEKDPGWEEYEEMRRSSEISPGE